MRVIKKDQMGSSHLGWLDSQFHFSFADYYNPFNMNFGVLRVLNDDLIEPNAGFPMHPHKNMEIVTYVIDGELTHGDSMGNKQTIQRGHVQYMSAGNGVYHSEENFGNKVARLLQLWIVPNQLHLKPNYGDYRFTEDQRKNQWLHIVSNKENHAPVQIHQDVNIYVTEIDQDQTIDFTVQENRQVYLVLIEGNALINNVEVNERDAVEFIEESIHIQSLSSIHIMIIEMNKSV